MLIYELIYTGIGQFIAAYSPNATFAALVNPLIISIPVIFCGIFVPYVTCNEEEFAFFEPANGTCAEYLPDYMAGADASSSCKVCQYQSGTDFLDTLNIPNYAVG
ncbi:uncharacterized protein N7515_005785 [Penicillium bovifimosum]|uniref:Uncharacterized protein n=1 Tax=Penicillium bovifimosum TaxID=126998 RepID=A0A9W9GUR9_9EURO|nr:uncharacterized protein N7515_005785 [Penicillium bovifimosum]KAJ5129746.1 hypothetical protein N7515_005785 [Penicillium bovifimosum]